MKSATGSAVCASWRENTAKTNKENFHTVENLKFFSLTEKNMTTSNSKMPTGRRVQSFVQPVQDRFHEHLDISYLTSHLKTGSPYG